MTANASECRSVAPRLEEEDQAIQQLADFLQKTRAAAENQSPYLVSPAGERQEVPADVFKMLTYIVDALSAGQGVTVMPTNAQLTTQQAADHLGMSRPTLVRLLEKGEIPFTKVGRHRRVRFEDLLKYEKRSHNERMQSLNELTEEAISDGTYFAHPESTETR